MNCISVAYLTGSMFSIHAVCELDCSSFICGITAATNMCLGGVLFGPTMFWATAGMNGVALVSRALKRTIRSQLEQRVEERFRSHRQIGAATPIIIPNYGIPYGIQEGNEFARRQRLEFSEPIEQAAG